MLITPYQVALHTDRLDALGPVRHTTAARWTWIAGKRYRVVRRL
ncbi:MAG: hypothetical protein JWM86_1135 [Thermoleophilia bacterium]|nr:hypothetical protein [Thermoleophilia bacterium]